MGKKLTDEQKAANKAATKERNRAFNARRNAYETELKAAEDAAQQLPQYAAMVAAQESFENAMAQRDSALTALDQEIARLQAQREELRKQHAAVIDAAKDQRSLTYDANDDVTRSLTDEVKARYPDVVNCWYASMWQRPEGV
jgi:hypothetical protein